MNPDEARRGSSSREAHGDPDHRAHIRGLALKLHIDGEMIDVWLDDTGIHFSQPDGTHTQGHLPWDIAIAMSLVPPHQPRMETAVAV